MTNVDLSPVLKMNFSIDLPRLKEVLDRVGVLERLHPDHSSVALMHRPGAPDPWMDGIAPFLGDQKSEVGFSEGSFTQSCPGLEGTYFESTVSLVRSEINNPLGRIRILKRKPLTTSSAHLDYDVRLHIPILTNENSYLIFPDSGVFHLPADGSVYLVDTTRTHFAVNAHRHLPRFHMIINTYCGFTESRENHGEVLKFARSFFADTAASRKCTPVTPLKRG